MREAVIASDVLAEFNDIRVLSRPGRTLHPLTEYIYQFYSGLLTEEERALQRYFWYSEDLRKNDQGSRERLLRRTLGIDELLDAHPTMMTRIQAVGIAGAMREASERVLRQSSAEVLFNTCPRCGTLCQTPRAKACLACGHSWHHQSGVKS